MWTCVFLRTLSLSKKCHQHSLQVSSPTLIQGFFPDWSSGSSSLHLNLCSWPVPPLKTFPDWSGLLEQHLHLCPNGTNYNVFLSVIICFISHWPGNLLFIVIFHVSIMDLAHNACSGNIYSKDGWVINKEYFLLFMSVLYSLFFLLCYLDTV
jgi:hypothetical protein